MIKELKIWIKYKIHGKYLREIHALHNANRELWDDNKDLKGECEGLRASLAMMQRQTRDLNSTCNELKESIEKIESNIRPPRFDDNFHSEMRFALHVVDRPYFDFVAAITPANISLIDAVDDESYIKKQTLKLDTSLVGVYPTENGLLNEASYELQVMMARKCGEWVTHRLLADQGWRCKKQFNEFG